MSQIRIRLFGAFRKFVPSGRLELYVKEGLTAKQLKAEIQSALESQTSEYLGSTLVFESALATESEVLSEDCLIDEKMELALLPPVCGG